MYFIAHCDDSELEHDISGMLIEHYCEETGRELSLDHYMSGIELIEAMKAGKTYDICILDYIMPEIKGVELADTLRKMGYSGMIIFISSTTEYVMDSFGVHPFYCLEKPVSPEKLRTILDSAFQELDEKNPKMLVVKTDEGERQFLIKDILYISRYDRSVQYVVYGGSAYNTQKLRTSFRDSVGVIAEEEGFLMLGTMIINMNRIDVVSKDEVIFKDGTHFAPPTVHMKTIKEKLKEFRNNKFGKNYI